MFSVFLENQHVKAQVGWYPKERHQRVDLWVSVLVELRTGNFKEELSRTVDYAVLVGIVITESSKERKLLETLASDIVDAIETEYRPLIHSAEVTIRKNKIQVTGYDADGVGIRYRRIITE